MWSGPELSGPISCPAIFATWDKCREFGEITCKVFEKNFENGMRQVD
jgi:hypothetical protein